MTVSTNDRRKEYIGNGVTTEFAGPKAFDADHIKVYLAHNTTGVSVLISPSSYTLTGIGRAATKVTLDAPTAAAVTAAYSLVILRTVPYEQGTDITNQGAYLPETHENALDYQEFEVQQLDDRMSRMLQGDETASDSAWNFDAGGRRIINLGTGIALTDAVNLQQVLEQIEVANSGGPVYGITPIYWEFDTDGVETDFAIPGGDVDNPAMYDVVVNRDAYEPFDDYSIVLDEVDLVGYEGSLLRFSAAPPAGTGWVILRGYRRAYSLGDPVTALQLLGYSRVRPVTEAGTAFTLDKETHGHTEQGVADVRTTNAAAVTATLRKNTGDAALDWMTGDFFTITQTGTGAVTIDLPVGVTIDDIPAGYLAKPRAKGCSITLRCVSADLNKWNVSGDLAIDGVDVGEQPEDEASNVVASAAGVLTLDLAQGNFFAVTLTENITSIVLTGEPLAGFARTVRLEIIQHASAAKTVAFPAWKWPGGSVGVVSTALGAIDELNLIIDNRSGAPVYRAVLTKGFA